MADLPDIGHERMGKPVAGRVGAVSAELQRIDLQMRILGGEIDVRLRVAEDAAHLPIRPQKILHPDGAAEAVVVRGGGEDLAIKIAAGVVQLAVGRPTLLGWKDGRQGFGRHSHIGREGVESAAGAVSAEVAVSVEMAERRFCETIRSREHEAALLRDDGRRIDLVLHILADYPEADLAVVKPLRLACCVERWKAILLRIGVEPLLEDSQIKEKDARAGQGERSQVILKGIEGCIVIGVEAGLKARRPKRTRRLTNG